MFAKAALAALLALASAPALASDVTYDPLYPGTELRANQSPPAPSHSDAKAPASAPCKCACPPTR